MTDQLAQTDNFISSAHIVDYRFRPNKSAERKMLLELFDRLHHFEPLHTYRYIGFGAIAFIDFQLIHKHLRITDMVSFEADSKIIPRCEFNKPYEFIQVRDDHFGNAITDSDIGGKRVIIWLDYDKPLNSEMLNDIRKACKSVQSGSILLVTINTNIGGGNSSSKKKIHFEEQTGYTLQSEDEVNAENIYRTLRKTVIQAIDEEINGRNGLRKANNLPHEINYQQVLNIKYQDSRSAPMLTIGVVFYSPEEEEKYKNCEFRDLVFYNDEGEPIILNLPKLTQLERFSISKPHPSSEDFKDIISKIGLSKDDLNCYFRFFKYYPNYAEIELT